MTTEQRKKGDDGELSSILIACGVFTLTLLIIDFTYSGIHDIVSSWLCIPFYISHILLAGTWAIVISKKNEPNYEVSRKWLLVINIIALLFILGHRVGVLDRKMFDEEVNKNKQEQR